MGCCDDDLLADVYPRWLPTYLSLIHETNSPALLERLSI